MPFALRDARNCVVLKGFSRALLPGEAFERAIVSVGVGMRLLRYRLSGARKDAVRDEKCLRRLSDTAGSISQIK